MSVLIRNSMLKVFGHSALCAALGAAAFVGLQARLLPPTEERAPAALVWGLAALGASVVAVFASPALYYFLRHVSLRKALVVQLGSAGLAMAALMRWHPFYALLGSVAVLLLAAALLGWRQRLHIANDPVLRALAVLDKLEG